MWGDSSTGGVSLPEVHSWLASVKSGVGGDS